MLGQKTPSFWDDSLEWVGVGRTFPSLLDSLMGSGAGALKGPAVAAAAGWV